MREPNLVDPYIRYNPNTRLFEPVWFWRDVLPYWLGPDPQFTTGATTLPAAPGLPAPVIYKLAHNSLSMDKGVGNPLIIDRILFQNSNDANSLTTANAAFTILVKDMGDSLQYMNFPVHIRTFAGSAQLPALLSEPLLMPTRHNLVVNMASIGAASSAQLFFAGGWFDTWSTNLQTHPLDHQAMIALVNKYLERRNYVYPFWFTTDYTPMVLNANQTGQIDVTVGDDGQFEATHIMAVSTGSFEVEFFNPKNRQTLMNGRIHSGFIGNSFNPQPLPASLLLEAGSQVRFIFKDLSGSANTIYLTLRGRRIRASLKDAKDIDNILGKPPILMPKQAEMIKR